uniref:Ycf36 n=1 Tax=Platysiphonia delicata TaxID=2006979 RepID=A0A1Z1M0L7_9FLOR|nr:hypothetical protein [Platysiphonia delicata]ARW59606.1 hypothetical protein [Platysiphonia delicata]
MSSFKSNCPVPFSQQPLNEYLELKNSYFFSWCISDFKSYTVKLLSVFSFLFVFFGFFILSFYFSTANYYRAFILNLLLIDVLLIFIFFRLYIGWSHVTKRLLSATIFYEESGWYDGQIWIKTSSSLTRDRLISLYQAMPFLKRIKYTFFIFCFNFILHFYLYSYF